MMRHRRLRPVALRLSMIALAMPLAAPLTAPAAAGDINGVRQRSDGVGSVRFALRGTGEALCGSIVKSGKEGGQRYLGPQVFIDMASTGADAWAGMALNPCDGKTCAATVTMSGDHLMTGGCAFGGLICKTISWSCQG